MSDEAKALHLLMQRLAATEAQWQEEKARADEARAEVERLGTEVKESMTLTGAASTRATRVEDRAAKLEAEVERLRAALDAERDWRSVAGLVRAALAATERQWQEEKERADEAERGEGEAWRQVDEVRRERDEARAIHREREEKWQRDWDARTARMEKAEAEVERLREEARQQAKANRRYRRQRTGLAARRWEQRGKFISLKAALAASQAREAKLRDALRGLEQCISWSDTMQQWVLYGRERTTPALAAARAALAEVEP